MVMNEMGESERPRRPWLEAMYDEAAYLDLWTGVHVLTGMVVAGWALLVGISVEVIIVGSFVGFVLWEVLEAWLGIHEYWTNRVADVVFDLIGLGAVLMPVLLWDVEIGVIPMMLLTLSLATLEAAGYLAYRAAGRVHRRQHKTGNPQNQ